MGAWPGSSETYLGEWELLQREPVPEASRKVAVLCAIQRVEATGAKDGYHNPMEDSGFQDPKETPCIKYQPATDCHQCE